MIRRLWNAKVVVKLYFDCGLTLFTAGFITLGCIFSPWWLLGTIATASSFALVHALTTATITKDKKRLNELIEQKNLMESTKELTKNHEDKKEIGKTSKTKKSIISKNIEKTETKDNDLTL